MPGTFSQSCAASRHISVPLASRSDASEQSGRGQSQSQSARGGDGAQRIAAAWWHSHQAADQPPIGAPEPSHNSAEARCDFGAKQQTRTSEASKSSTHSFSICLSVCAAVEYAKSGRSTCKGCQKLIDQGELRIGKMVQSPHFDGEVRQTEGTHEG